MQGLRLTQTGATVASCHCYIRTPPTLLTLVESIQYRGVSVFDKAQVLQHEDHVMQVGSDTRSPSGGGEGRGLVSLMLHVVDYDYERPFVLVCLIAGAVVL